MDLLMRCLGVACAAALLLAAPAARADEDEEARVRAHFARVAEALDALQDARVEGQTVQSQKFGNNFYDVSTTFRVVLSKPNRMRFEITGPEIEQTVVADGTTVTIMSPREKTWTASVQAPTLEQYYLLESERELYDSLPGYTYLTQLVPLLVASDPGKHLTDLAVTLHDDGQETVSESLAQRLRITVKSPDSVFTVWADCETSLPVQLALFTGQDADGQPVQSFDQARAGVIHVTTVTSLTTETAAKDADFAVRIPRGWKDENEAGDEAEVETVASRAGSSSLWERMVRRAGSQTGARYLMLLESSRGFDTPTTSPVWLPRRDVLSLGSFKDRETGEMRILAVTARRELLVLDGRGQVVREGTLPHEPTNMYAVETSTETLVAASYSHAEQGVGVHRLDGSEVWNYKRDSGSMTNVLVTTSPASAEPEVWVTCSDSGGLRRFGAWGDLRFANRRQTPLATPVAGPIDGEDWALIVPQARSGLALFNAKGEFMRHVRTVQQPLTLMIDPDGAPEPVITMTLREPGEQILQRLDRRGRPMWTVSVSQSTGFELEWFYTSGMMRRSAVTPLLYCVVSADSRGNLHLVDTRGQSIWRGQVVVKTTQGVVQRDRVIRDVLLADIDGDGSDELLVATEHGLIPVRFMK